MDGCQNGASPVMRTVFRCIILVAMVLEHEFLNYIVQHVYDRGVLRRYVSDYLAQALEKFVSGTITRSVSIAEVDAFSIETFVREAATYYACMFRPGGTPHALPPVGVSSAQ